MVAMKASYGRLLDQPNGNQAQVLGSEFNLGSLEGETTTCQKQAHSSHALAGSLGRSLAQVPTPPSTATHVPVPHAAVVEALVDTLSHRQISVVDEEFALSKDEMEMFGVLDLATGFEGSVSRSASGMRTTSDFAWHAPSVWESSCATILRLGETSVRF